MRTWEETRLEALTSDIFGFNAVQIGAPGIDALRGNRMPNKWLTDTKMPVASKLNSAVHMVLAHDFSELPFASQSLDLLVLPHVLEFAGSPHQVLREMERVLRPEGQAIICGFNPTSLWGLRHVAGRVSSVDFLPQQGEFIGLPRLKDWLKLLNMEVSRGHFGCYSPPFASEKWLNRFSFMDGAGQRWWPYFGAVYIVQAIKRVKGMRLIGPVWSTSALLPKGVPATHQVQRKEHGQD